jgi:hypothetical protein
VRHDAPRLLPPSSGKNLEVSDSCTVGAGCLHGSHSLTRIAAPPATDFPTLPILIVSDGTLVGSPLPRGNRV